MIAYSDRLTRESIALKHCITVTIGNRDKPVTECSLSWTSGSTHRDAVTCNTDRLTWVAAVRSAGALPVRVSTLFMAAAAAPRMALPSMTAGSGVVGAKINFI